MMPMKLPLSHELSTRLVKPAQYEPEPEEDVSKFLSVLMRRKSVFATILLSFFAIVVGLTLIAPKSYTTTAKLIAGNPGSGGSATTSLPVLNALVGARGSWSPETYLELLQETPVAEEVISDLNLHVSPSGLLAKMHAQPVTGTSILTVSVTWADPVTSAKVTNQFANVFVKRERELIAGQADSALTFLSDKIPPAETAMRNAENDLAQYQAAHTQAFVTSQGIGSSNGIGLSATGSISELTATETRISQVQIDEQQAHAQLANVLSQEATVTRSVPSSTSVSQNPVLENLKSQLAQVNVQLNAALRQYTDAHPTVIGLKEQKAQLEKQIAGMPATVVSGTTTSRNPTYEHLDEQAAALRAQIASDESQLLGLASQRTELLRTVKRLPTEASQLADLQRKAKLAETVYTTLQQRYNDAEIAKTASLSDVAITQQAAPEDSTVKPNLPLNVMLGFLIGLVLAVSGVFVVDYFDSTFKDERDVEREVALPVLTSVPKLTEGTRQALPWLRALTLDSFLQLVTALRYSSDKPLRSIAVTSPLEGDGKSTLALNLAIALADIQSSVLLVDGDLRRPTLHIKLGVENDRGFSDALIGAADDAYVTRPTKHAGLDLLTAGTAVPSPIKLLQSDRFHELYERLVERYKIVIFDTPALVPVFEGALIAAKSDGTVLVVSSGKTDSRSAKRALQRLQSVGQPNVLGVILNQVSPSHRDYAYYRQQHIPLVLTEGSDEVSDTVSTKM